MARPATMTALAFIILAALGGLGWLVYERVAEGDGEQAPLIRADDGPMKIRPKDPGGMAVPDQDKLIYQTLNGGVAEETAERLLPPPEEPLPPPEPPKPPQPPEPESVAQPPAAAAPEGQDSALPPLPPAEIGRQAEAPAEVEVRSSEPEVAPAPREPSLAKTLATAPQPPAPKPAAVTAPKPAEVAASSGPYVAGPYMVQLASLRSIDDADKAWRMAVKKNGDLLSAHSARVVRADLGGDQGVFYRLRIGPFAERQEARSLCAKLKARNVDCIVVKP